MKRKTPVEESTPPDSNGVDCRDLSPAERIGMMWPLAVKAWGLKGDERMQRHVVALKKLKDK